MKKIVLSLAVLMTLGLAACSSKAEKAEDTVKDSTEVVAEDSAAVEDSAVVADSAAQEEVKDSAKAE